MHVPFHAFFIMISCQIGGFHHKGTAAWVGHDLIHGAIGLVPVHPGWLAKTFQPGRTGEQIDIGGGRRVFRNNHHSPKIGAHHVQTYNCCGR